MSQESVLPVLTDFVPQAAGRRRVRLPVLEARGGDHATIYYFLQSVFQGPSRAEFHASLRDPFYELCDRLLLWQKRRIAAHAHLTHRTMHFGSATIPVAGLTGLGVAPEHRNQGLGTHLLRTAESRMAIGGAWWECCEPRSPIFSVAAVGRVRTGQLSPGGRPGVAGPALGARPDSPPPPPAAHPPLAAMGTGGIGTPL